MNVESYSEYLKLGTAEEREKWMGLRIAYLKRKSNYRLHYKMQRAVDTRRTSLKPCEHRTRVTVFEPGSGPSTREEAEVSYCTDMCKRQLKGVAA